METAVFYNKDRNIAGVIFDGYAYYFNELQVFKKEQANITLKTLEATNTSLKIVTNINTVMLRHFVNCRMKSTDYLEVLTKQKISEIFTGV